MSNVNSSESSQSSWLKHSIATHSPLLQKSGHVSIKSISISDEQ